MRSLLLRQGNLRATSESLRARRKERAIARETERGRSSEKSRERGKESVQVEGGRSTFGSGESSGRRGVGGAADTVIVGTRGLSLYTGAVRDTTPHTATS